MAKNSMKKKKKKLSISKEASRNRFLPNFPEPLRALIDNTYGMCQGRVSDSGPIKAWGTSTKRCGIDRRSHPPQLYEIGDPIWCSYTNTLPKSYSYVSGGFSLSVPVWSVPSKFIFGTYIEQGLSFVHFLLTGISCPAFMVGRSDSISHNTVWTGQDCTMIDPYGCDNQFMEFRNAVYFQSKLYALSLQGTLAVMEYVSEELTVTCISRCRAVPCVRARYFKEHMFESDGEILLVFLIYQRSLSMVDKVEVFRLEFPTLEWIKVTKIGSRAVFLENKNSIWINSAEIGCKPDSVYFTLDKGDKWWIYDMGSDCLSAACFDHTTRLG